MGFTPGRGVGFGKVIVGGLLGLGAIAGLSVGISIEQQKSSVLDHQIDELKDELRTNRLIADDINIDPPDGKGFINFR